MTKNQVYRKTKIGTKAWIAPEIVESKIYSKKIDVYSFGCFMYELGKGEAPFKTFMSRGEESLFDAIANATEADFRCEDRSQ